MYFSQKFIQSSGSASPQTSTAQDRRNPVAQASESVWQLSFCKSRPQYIVKHQCASHNYWARIVVATQTLQPVWFELRLIEGTQAEACATQDPRHRRANPSRARDISGLADYGKTHIARYSDEGSGVLSVGYYSCPLTAFCSSDSPPCSKRSSQEINSARVQSGWYL